MPRSTAARAAATRVGTSSLARMRVTCPSTVRALMKSASAISRSRRPSASSLSTSRSLGDNRLPGTSRVGLASTGGESASIAPVEIPNAGTASSSTPVTFKLVKKRGKIEVTINGVHATYTGGIDIDVSGWSQNLCVGLALTSHSGARLSTALVTDVTFTVNHPTGTVLTLK